MPIIIDKDLPAHDILLRENIFLMHEERAVSQDIRPIEIAILNLMPTKIETETQLFRLLGNTPLQVNITLINTETYKSKNTSETHLMKFYKNFSEIEDKHFDGMIITGAPVETWEFEKVAYWDELKKIMDYAQKMVTSTIYICWGAQAAMYHFFGIGKFPLDEKMFGIFPTVKTSEYDPLLKGMDDVFYIPHSRHTEVDGEAVYNCKDIEVLAVSEQAGISIAKTHDGKMIFLTGHSEYDRYTLKGEYDRDVAKGLPIKKPFNYFADDTCEKVNMSWSGSANLLFYNWLNYYVYQVTPYDFKNT